MTRPQIATVGYEAMKLFVKPHVYLWLASEGWRQCFEVTAEPIPDSDEIKVWVQAWSHGGLVPDFHPN